MNTELTKVLDVLAVLEAHTGNIFNNLSSKEKLHLAAKIHAIAPGSDTDTVVTSVISIYRDIDTYNTSAFADLSLFDKLMIACDVRGQETGGNATGEPVEAVDAIPAFNTFTVGGETDSDIAEDDTITIGEITITAVAADATPGDYEFCIDDDKDVVIENIIACIEAIPGNSVIPWTAEAGDSPTIIITAKEAGTGGESIETTITSEGDSAFSSLALAGGVDAVEETSGHIGRILADGMNIYVKTQLGFRQVGLLSDLTDFITADDFPIKIVKRTIGGVGVANCDINFATAANMNEQSIDVEADIPSLGKLLSVIVHTNNTFTGAVSLALTAGFEAGDDSIIGSHAAFAANAVGESTAGSLAPTFVGSPIFINATPGANWSLVTAGKMTVYVAYLDVSNA